MHKPNYHELQEIIKSNGVRFNHQILDTSCTGNSRSVITSETKDGIRLHCFRCGVNFLARSPSSAAARNAQQVLVQAYENHELDQPEWKHGFPKGEADLLLWPRSARNWILSYANVSTASRNGIVWDWLTQRLWLPVMLDGHPVKWAGRKFGDSGPKYLTGQVKGYQYHDCFGSGSTVVLTEDILGALRLAQDLPCRTYPMLGTYMDKLAILKLSERADRVVVWLDNDGQLVLRARRKLVRQLQGYGLEVGVYKGNSDPKREVLLDTQNGRDKLIKEFGL